MLLLLFHQQIYCIFVNKPTSAVGNNLYMPYQSHISVKAAENLMNGTTLMLCPSLFISLFLSNKYAVVDKKRQ